MSNILIYGSCVSRDAFELLKDEQNLIAYIARQSLISAVSPGTELLNGNELKSKFQNRMLNGDLASNLLPTLRNHRSSIDLILMDLTDERLGVHKMPDNSFVTHSSELVESGRLNAVKPTPGIIPIGTDRHWNFWVRAAKIFSSRLESLGLKEKVLVVNTAWAEASFEGVPVPLFRSTSTADMNAYLSRMADMLKDLGIRVVDMPNSLAISTLKHKWGIAPFHYGAPAYQWIRDQVERDLGQKS